MQVSLCEKFTTKLFLQAEAFLQSPNCGNIIGDGKLVIAKIKLSFDR